MEADLPHAARVNLPFPRRVLAVYAMVGLALWPVPVFNILHVESSAVVALVAFFTAGLTSLRLFARQAAFRGVLLRQEAALLVPWAMLTVTLLWTPNCAYFEGLLLFFLFPVASVVLAVALAFGLSSSRLRRKRLLFVLLGAALVVLTPVYDLGLHPQFYTYNHVFGGVLGPIYDEDLAVRPGLFAFRGLTLLWAGVAFFIGQRLRAEAGDSVAGRRASSAVALLAGLIGLVYFFSAPLGLNTPAWYSQRKLSAVHRTEHFDIFYDAASATADEIAFIGLDHEYRYARLAEQLGVAPTVRIESYLYPDAETKARLTGARFTNVAPVWLPTPQSHVLFDAYADVFPHELVHVFSRSFGLPALNASLSVGLVEGLAVALEPPDGRPTPDEQVMVALAGRIGLGERDASLADEIAARLSPIGFWSGRGAVSYTTMGSFVKYLLAAYGAERLKAVYPRANFEAVYGKPVEALVTEWEGFLAQRTVIDRAAGALTAKRFTALSLFEKPCPHHVAAYRRRYQEGSKALARGDTTRAKALFEASLARQPGYVPALAAWSQVMLAQDRPDAVLARLDTMRIVSPALSFRRGDALAMLGRADAARLRYEEALAGLPPSAQEEHAWTVLRIALAEDPALVRTLVSSKTPRVQAERLGAAPGWAAQMMRSLQLAADGAYEQAARVLRTTALPANVAFSEGHRRLLEYQRLVWLAYFEYRSGNAEEAIRNAERVAQLYQEVGARNAAAWLRDYAQKVRWTVGAL